MKCKTLNNSLLAHRPLIPLTRQGKTPSVSKFQGIYFGLGDKTPYKSMLESSTDVGLVLGLMKGFKDTTLIGLDFDQPGFFDLLIKRFPILKETCSNFRYDSITHEKLSHGHLYLAVEGFLPHRACCKIKQNKMSIGDCRLASGYFKVIGENTKEQKDGTKQVSYYNLQNENSLVVLTQDEFANFLDILESEFGIVFHNFYTRSKIEGWHNPQNCLIDARLLPGQITDRIIKKETKGKKSAENIVINKEGKVIQNGADNVAAPLAPVGHTFKIQPKISLKTQQIREERARIYQEITEERSKYSKWVTNQNPENQDVVYLYRGKTKKEPAGENTNLVTTVTPSASFNKKLAALIQDYKNDTGNIDVTTGLFKTNELIFVVNRLIFNEGLSEQTTPIFTYLFNTLLDCGRRSRHSLSSFLKEALSKSNYIKAKPGRRGSEIFKEELKEEPREYTSLFVQLIAPIVDSAEIQLKYLTPARRIIIAYRVIIRAARKNPSLLVLLQFVTRRDIEIAFAYRNSDFADKVKAKINVWLKEYYQSEQFKGEKQDKEKSPYKKPTTNIVLAGFINNFATYNDFETIFDPHGDLEGLIEDLFR